MGCAHLAFPGDADRIEVKERLDSVVIKGEVVAIHHDSRMVTLAGPLGNLVTLEASDAVERFAEIEAGDLVAAKYMTYIMAEFREPTQDELDEPLVVLAEAGKAGSEDLPGGGIGAVVRAVVTVELIDEANRLVTIKGPRGNYLTLPVEDDEVLKQVKVGEVVIMTYAEALALSLEKVDPPQASQEN
jgi:hypothetical protein